jgi:hypothetical protein
MNTCDKCDKEFKFNYLLKRHQNNKFPCITDTSLITKYDNKINNIDTKILELTEQSIQTKKICMFCNKKFNNKNNVERHIFSSCIIKKEMIDNKNKIIEEKNKLEKQEETNKLREEILSLKKVMANIIEKNNKNKNDNDNDNITFNQVINNNINNINNTNNNLIININPLGKENLTHITEADYKKYLSGFFPGFIQFIEKIHFDDNAPENHNICITNLKSKHVYVNENNKWIVKEKHDILDNFITKKYNLLTDKFEEFEENNIINDKIIDNFKEFQENYDNVESQKNTKNNIMLMMYNNRDKVKTN